uniref:Ig-like domain-containing protein n=1 Tax=Ditylenchus dipsaci TaxID=166011 RepID=A0A915ESC6_9BILA
MWKCPLSSFELFFCFVVSTCYYATAFLSGCYTTYKFSSAPTNSIDYKWASGWIVDSPYISGWQTDTSDGEWKLFRNSVSKTTLVLLLHSAWISCVFVVVTMEHWAPFSSQLNNSYREGQLYLYKSIQILNICTHMQSNRIRLLGIPVVSPILCYANCVV